MSQGVYALGGKCPGCKCPGGTCPGGYVLEPSDADGYPDTTMPLERSRYLYNV